MQEHWIDTLLSDDDNQPTDDRTRRYLAHYRSRVHPQTKDWSTAEKTRVDRMVRDSYMSHLALFPHESPPHPVMIVRRILAALGYEPAVLDRVGADLSQRRERVDAWWRDICRHMRWGFFAT